MATEHRTGDDTEGGSPAAQPRAWGTRATLLALGIAAAIAVLGGAVIYAATGQSSPQFIGPPGQHGPGPGGGLPPAASAAGTGLGTRGHAGPPVHGQVVVDDGSGGFVTVLSQTGVVTGVTAHSLTVRSPDGFVQSWALAQGQGSAAAVDDSVMIQGEQTAGEPLPKVTQVLDPLVTPR